MRRRIAIALVGMVVAALVLTGAGTIALASIADRRADQDELVEQTEAIGALMAEVTIVAAPDGGETVRERLARVTRAMSVEGIGILVVPRNATEPIGQLPDGIDIDDIDVEAVQRGATITGVKDGLLFAATGVQNTTGGRTLLVLTRERAAIVAPAFGWALIAGAITVGLALVVTVRLTARLTSPIRSTSSTAKRIADGDLTARIDERHAELGGEVAELVHSVNAMAGNLERSRALERQFLLSVSHDLRTPLTSIRGYAEALTDGAADDPTAVGEVIEGESRRLERLVGDLLLLARLEGTGFEFRTGVHDARELVDDSTQSLFREAAERDIELAVRMPAEPVLVEVDPDRFGQVVANLVGNALKFADHRASVTLWFAEGRVHLSVGDDGPGIGDADLPHVFERLYVAQHNPKIRESGSGLGLAIVRELAEGMGGTVVARRSELGGAEFVASFPPAS